MNKTLDIKFTYHKPCKIRAGVHTPDYVSISGGDIPDGWHKTLEGHDIYKWLVFYQSKEKELVELHNEIGKLLTKHMLDIPKEILDEFHDIGIDLK